MYKNNGNVDVSQVSDTHFSIYGKSIGESVVEVKDAYGKGKTVVVRIKSNTANIIDTQYTPSVENGYI